MTSKRNEPDLMVPGRWRTSRRARLCKACGALIYEGDRYFEQQAGVGKRTSRTYHPACAERAWGRT